MKLRSLILGTAFTLCAASAFAADAPPAMPMLIRGTIASIDAKIGHDQEGGRHDGHRRHRADDRSISAVEPRRLDQIKPTDFVGITSVPAPNGDLMAEEIHIIPLKGLGEGSYPWDHHPDGAKPMATGSMTNATVAMVHNGATSAGSMTNAHRHRRGEQPASGDLSRLGDGERQMRRPCRDGEGQALHGSCERGRDAVDGDRRDRSRQGHRCEEPASPSSPT